MASRECLISVTAAMPRPDAPTKIFAECYFSDSLIRSSIEALKEISLRFREDLIRPLDASYT